MRRTSIILLSILTVLLLTVCASARAADDALLAVDLSKADGAQLTGEGWGEATTVDERPCRVAKAGKNSWLAGQAWWNEGLRPAQGDYFLVEVVYKDTAKSPIRLSVWAGLHMSGEAGSGHSELHRFGGLNDGQWKTAKIPLGWDMVMVRPGSRLVEFAIASDGGDVPVASLRVVPLPAAAVQAASMEYNAETRSWVRQVQKQYVDGPHTELSAPQKPAGDVAKRKEALVPYVRTWMTAVYPYSSPQEGEAGAVLKAQMALNEYEPAAFGVYAPAKDLTHVTVTAEPLQLQGDAKATLPVEVRTAEYAFVPNGKNVAIFPQRLWPMFATQINKGQSGWFWLTFQSQAGKTKPGLYRGKVVIQSDQGSSDLEVNVRVLPITLLDMNQTDLMMGGCITGMVSRHDMDEMMRHNHNQLQYWYSGVYPTFVVKEKGDFELDFTLLDDQFEQARQAGIKANVYFLGGDPYGWPGTQSLLRELARQVLGMDMDGYVELMTKDKDNIPKVLVPLYKKWVRLVQTHARDKGWPEQILTPFDEPAKWVQGPGRKREGDTYAIGTGPWIKPQFEQCCTFIHQADPKTRIYGSIHHATPGLPFLKDVDIFCTNAIGEDAKLGDKVRAADTVFWQYSGAGVASPPDRARYTYGFYFHAFNSRGSLCWAYNWYQDRFNNSEGNNWGYAWYTPTDMIPAPYYEGMREAWDDRRYIETLRKVAKDKGVDVEPMLAQMGKAACDLRGQGGRDTVIDFWEEAKQVGRLDQMRERIAARIMEISEVKAADSKAATIAK